MDMSICYTSMQACGHEFKSLALKKQNLGMLTPVPIAYRAVWGVTGGTLGLAGCQLSSKFSERLPQGNKVGNGRTGH